MHRPKLTGVNHSPAENSQKPASFPSPRLHRSHGLLPRPDSLPARILPRVTRHRTEVRLPLRGGPLPDWGISRGCKPGGGRPNRRPCDTRHRGGGDVHHVGHRGGRHHAAEAAGGLDRHFSGVRGVGEYMWSIVCRPAICDVRAQLGKPFLRNLHHSMEVKHSLSLWPSSSPLRKIPPSTYNISD